MDEPTAMAHRALLKLNPGRMRRYVTLDAFAAALERIDVDEGRNMRPGVLLLAALAIHSYEDSLHLEAENGDYYLIAASVAELNSWDTPWEAMIDDGRVSVDGIAEVLELMIIETAESSNALSLDDYMTRQFRRYAAGV